MVTIFKDKEDVQKCENYKGITFMSHSMKMWKNVIYMRVKSEIFVKFVLLPGRSTMEPIFLLDS